MTRGPRTDVRKHGERAGSDTLLVHAVNYDNSLSEVIKINISFSTIHKFLAVYLTALSCPPEKYNRIAPTTISSHSVGARLHIP